MHDLKTLKQLNEQAVAEHNAGIEKAARVIFQGATRLVEHWDALHPDAQEYWRSVARSAHNAYFGKDQHVG